MEKNRESVQLKTRRLRGFVDKQFVEATAYLILLLRKNYLNPSFHALRNLFSNEDIAGALALLSDIAQENMMSKEQSDNLFGNVLMDTYKTISSNLKANGLLQNAEFIDAFYTFVSSLTDEDVVEIVRGSVFKNDFANDYTAPSVCKLAVKLLNIKQSDSVADLCCGQGSFLSSVEETKDLYGCDISFDSLLNAFKVCDVMGKRPVLEQRDLLTNKTKQFDKIFLEYPWGYIYHRQLDSLNVEEWKPLPVKDLKRSMTSWVFIAKALSCLKQNGIAVIHVQDSALYSTYENEIRKTALEMGLIKAVISLPQKINTFATVKNSLLVLSYGNTNVRFVDASNMGESVDRLGKVVALSDKEISKIVDLVNSDVESEISTSVHRLDLVVQGKNLDVRLILKPKALLEIKDGVPLDSIATGYVRSVIGNASYLTRENETGIRVLMSADIQDGNVDVSELQYVSAEGMEHLIGRWKENLVTDGDVVMTNKSTTIKSAVIDTKGEKVVLFGSLCGIRLNKNKAVPTYVSTFINSNAGQTLLQTIQTGTTIQMITLGNLKELIVPCPKIEIQKNLVKQSEITLEMIKDAKERIKKLKQQYESSFDSLIMED